MQFRSVGLERKSEFTCPLYQLCSHVDADGTVLLGPWDKWDEWNKGRSLGLLLSHQIVQGRRLAERRKV